MKDNQAEGRGSLTHTIDVPLAFYEWLATIEKDVLAHDLTPHEIAGLIAALRTERKESAEIYVDQHNFEGPSMPRILQDLQNWLNDRAKEDSLELVNVVSIEKLYHGRTALMTDKPTGLEVFVAWRTIP
jgi:hypothetical protein